MVNTIREALPDTLVKDFDYLMTRLMTAENDSEYAEACLSGNWPGWEWIKEAKKNAGCK